MNQLPEPLTPADCDLRDFPYMPLDVARLRDSKLKTAVKPDRAFFAVLLWCASWHQVPAASLPDDDAELAALAGFGFVVREWKKNREGALYGWVKCADGRFYHPVVAEKAREAWDSKHRYAYSKMEERMRKKNKVRTEKGLSELILPSFEQWNSIGRPSENDIFPPETQQPSGGKKPAFQKPSEVIPTENALKVKEGKGEGEVNKESSGHVVGTAQPVGDDFTPQSQAEWLRHLRDKHGFEVDPHSVNDRKKVWPVLSSWINAGITGQQLDLAVKKARDEAKEPIANLVAYVDRVLSSQAPPRASPQRQTIHDQRAHTIAVLTGQDGAQHDPDDPFTIDSETGNVHRIG